MPNLSKPPAKKKIETKVAVRLSQTVAVVAAVMMIGVIGVFFFYTFNERQPVGSLKGVISLLTSSLKSRTAQFSPGFPRVAMFTQQNTPSDEHIDEIQKSDVWFVSRRTDLNQILEVKEANPDIKVIAFNDLLCGIPEALGEEPNIDKGLDYTLCDTDENFHETHFFDCELYSWLEENDEGNGAWLYREDDGKNYVGFQGNWMSLIEPNLSDDAPEDDQGRRFSEFFPDFVNESIFENGFDYARVDEWDGVMFDCAGSLNWTVNAFNEGKKPDFDRDNVGESFYPKWEDEGEIMFSNLRDYAGNKDVFGVNGVHWWRDYMNMYMIEHLDTRNPWACNEAEGDIENRACHWQTSMMGYTFAGDKHGYLIVEDDYFTKPYNIGLISVGWPCEDEAGVGLAACHEEGEEPTDEQMKAFHQFERFWLGTTMLGDGYISLNQNPPSAYVHTHWSPYFDNGNANTANYLGQAKTECQMILENGELTDCTFRNYQEDYIGVYRRDFEKGIVLVNPSTETREVILEHSGFQILPVTE
ncbi:hypothetical protein KKG41_00610, partial [Patescibacteria group bacterium]|nr:hypothetical protein [Patescibacteria group bacterium]MBU1890710.1 hypothetical protein [Patescibacteria group bacterium]